MDFYNASETEYYDNHSGKSFPLMKGDTLDLDIKEKVKSQIMKRYLIPTICGSFYFLCLLRLAFFMYEIDEDTIALLKENPAPLVYVALHIFFCGLALRFALAGFLNRRKIVTDNFWWREGEVCNIKTQKLHTRTWDMIVYTYDINGEQIKSILGKRDLEQGDKVIVCYLNAERKNSIKKCITIMISADD